MKILVAGELNVDLVLGGYNAFPEPGKEVLANSASLTLGSSSAICAGALATLGVPVAFIGRAGCDVWGDLAVNRLSELGVDTSAVIRESGITTGITVSISSATDRAMVTYLGSIELLQAADVNLAAFAGVTHLHVSSYYLQRALRPGLRQLFAQAHAEGLTTSLDPGCDPANEWDRGGISSVLAETDVFFPNAVELAGIAGEPEGSDPQIALRKLPASALVIAKLGAEGALASIAGGREWIRQTPFPIVPVDTTGAGDSFNAGFLYSWLRDRNIRQALAYGAACGALSTRGVGGTAALPTAAEAAEFLSGQQ